MKEDKKKQDIRVVRINGRPTMLVIGREYKFKLKEGAVVTPYQSKEKGAPKKAAAKTPPS